MVFINDSSQITYAQLSGTTGIKIVTPPLRKHSSHLFTEAVQVDALTSWQPLASVPRTDSPLRHRPNKRIH